MMWRLVRVLAVVGCGTVGCGGESAKTLLAREVEFERLEQVTYLGAPCDPANDPSVFQLSGESGVLSWHECETTSDTEGVQLRTGQRELTANELSGVRRALGDVRPTTASCSFDGSDYLLDLTTTDGTDLMADADGGGGCSQPPEGRYAGRTFVSGLPSLHGLLVKLGAAN
jgi:hypothetical protein